MNRIRLGVNIDHVATIRQARRGREPDPVQAVLPAELGGADQITVHLREDRRHIQDRDLELIRRVLHTTLNLEMAAVPEMVKIALRIKPEAVSLVPEKRQEVTTEGGLNAARQVPALSKVVKRLGKAGIGVALFVDPEQRQIRASRETGAAAVEINTARYSESSKDDLPGALDKIRNAAALGKELGLKIYAGHGLNYHNVLPVAAIEEIEELNIGHSIISRSVFTGLENAVREMRALLP